MCGETTESVNSVCPISSLLTGNEVLTIESILYIFSPSTTSMSYLEGMYTINKSNVNNEDNSI